MPLKKKSGNAEKPAKSAKATQEKRKAAVEENYEVADLSFDENEEDDEQEYEKAYKLPEGKTRLVVLPPLKSWGIKRPWVNVTAHFLGDSIVKIIGDDVPEGIPMIIGCAKRLNGEKCAVCDAAYKWKNSRSKREKDLAGALYAGPRYAANVVVIGEGNNIVGPDKRAPRFFQFGKKIRAPLYAALKDGENFCDPKGLLQVRITRKGTGMATRYDDPPPKVLTQQKTIPLQREWLEQMADLRDQVPTVPKHATVKEWMGLLLSGGDRDIDDEIDDVDDDVF